MLYCYLLKWLNIGFGLLHYGGYAMKKKFKKAISVLLVAVMVYSAVPLAGCTRLFL